MIDEFLIQDEIGKSVIIVNNYQKNERDEIPENNPKRILKRATELK